MIGEIPIQKFNEAFWCLTSHTIRVRIIRMKSNFLKISHIWRPGFLNLNTYIPDKPKLITKNQQGEFRCSKNENAFFGDQKHVKWNVLLVRMHLLFCSEVIRLGLNELFWKFLVVFHWIDPPKNSQNFVENAHYPDATPLKISIRTHSNPAWN